MQGYNLVLVPKDPAISNLLIAQAQRLAPIASQYLLAHGKALPHATLTAFECTDDENVLAATDTYLKRQVTVTVEGLYIKLSKVKEDGLTRIGYMLKRVDPLISLQAEVFKKLSSAGMLPSTPSGNGYFPHFTLAFTKEKALALPPELMELPPALSTFPCAVRVGRSDAVGQLLSFL